MLAQSVIVVFIYSITYPYSFYLSVSSFSFNDQVAFQRVFL